MCINPKFWLEQNVPTNDAVTAIRRRVQNAKRRSMTHMHRTHLLRFLPPTPEPHSAIDAIDRKIDIPSFVQFTMHLCTSYYAPCIAAELLVYQTCHFLALQLVRPPDATPPELVSIVAVIE